MSIDVSKQNIKLTSTAQFENELEVCNKWYYMFGGIGAVLGVLSVSISMIVLLVSIGVLVGWRLKSKCALYEWKQLQKYTFHLDKQLPYEELMGKLVEKLMPLGLRVDASSEGPEVTYKNVKINVVYNEDGTFSMPWKIGFGGVLFEFRYITSYYNTVTIMSLVGYYIQQICADMEAGNAAEENKPVEIEEVCTDTNGITDVHQASENNKKRTDKFCPKCGKKCNIEAAFCGGCGNKFE